MSVTVNQIVQSVTVLEEINTVEISLIGVQGPQGIQGETGPQGPKGDQIYLGNIDGGVPESNYGGIFNNPDGGEP